MHLEACVSRQAPFGKRSEHVTFNYVSIDRQFQIQQAMEKEKISKIEIARRMKTSRAALLAPGNASVTLQALTRAAHAIGRELHVELV